MRVLAREIAYKCFDRGFGWALETILQNVQALQGDVVISFAEQFKTDSAMVFLAKARLGRIGKDLNVDRHIAAGRDTVGNGQGQL